MLRNSIKMILAAAAFAAVVAPGGAQEILKSSGPDGPILITGDAAVLEGGEPRKDLDCSVAPDKAELGFDLKFHAGYSVTLPLKELQGQGNRLSIVFHVVSKAGGGSVYFDQHVRVPPITQTSGDVLLNGVFDLGAGDYHVDWLMRDFASRYCSSSWDVTAALSPRDREVNVAIPANSIATTEPEKFQAEPPVERSTDAPLNVKVLMNFAADHPGAAAVAPQDRSALIGILRNLSRNPRLGRISLVTFNVEQQRVIYRQDFASQIDFPALGKALKSLSLGTVDARLLGNKNGGVEFLASLIGNEMAADPNVDGLIFVGPRSLIDLSVPEDELKHIAEPAYPLFYLNYTPDPLAVPWRDAIGRTVRFFKGREYTISGPRDLWNAVSESVDRMAKRKQVRGTTTIAAGSH